MTIASANQQYNASTQTTQFGPFPCLVVTIGGTDYKIPYGITVDTSGAAVDFATQTTLAALNTKVTACNTGAVVVSSSALPSGAATAAKQPALGTAGTAATDVITVQGIASMTALKVDGSAVTQPISGSVTANIGTVGTLATAAKQDTGNTSLATLAGAVSGTEVQVDIVTMPSVTISGTVTVGSHAVTNAGTFAVQVDGAALTSLQLLDDSVATVGSAITSKGFAAIGTDGTNARILKTDSGGELQVDVLTMPTVAVTGTFWQATQPVSLVSVPSHAVTNAGTFVVQENGAALTSLQLIDDTVHARNASPSKAVLIAAQDDADTGTTKLVQFDNASGGLMVSIAGVINAVPVAAAGETTRFYNNGLAVTPQFAKISASTSGNNTLVSAAGTSNKIRVLAYNFIGAGAVNAKFQSGAGGTDLTGLKYIAAAGGGICAPFNPLGWFETAANTLLNLNLSDNVAVGGELVYVVVS